MNKASVEASFSACPLSFILKGAAWGREFAIACLMSVTQLLFSGGNWEAKMKRIAKWITLILHWMLSVKGVDCSQQVVFTLPDQRLSY